MSRALRVALGVIGFYGGATLLCVSRPFGPVGKPWSWKIPQTAKTTALSDAQLADANEMQRRSQIEQSMVRMFHFVPVPGDTDIVDDKCEFEDPVASTAGREALETIVFGFQRITKEHTMDNIEIERYANAFTFKFDQTLRMFFLPAIAVPTVVYCEMNEDNTKVTKCFDHWYGKSFFGGLGLGPVMRAINGKLVYGWYLRMVCRQKLD
mmetsp:Transcript_70299/g.111783  ORF Transcript_70299/g.111783 Transcript_70299/m.111783 type:complete len:209 (-) Transcript_70299:207-833(-)